MIKKGFESYKSAFEIFNVTFGIRGPKRTIIDFEAALFIILTLVFVITKLEGLLFYLNQFFWIKIRSPGFTKTYENDSTFSCTLDKYLHLLFFYQTKFLIMSYYYLYTLNEKTQQKVIL
jgi:hypothetical protein